MSYIGREPQFGEYIVADSIASLQNSSRTNFPIETSGNPVTIGSVNNTFVSKNGLVLYPSDDFVVGGDGTSLDFIVAPAAIDDISIRILGNVFDVLTVEDNTITTTKIQNSAVTAAKLASNAVTTVKVLDSNITAAKLATDSVTTSKIVDASISTNKLIDGSVTSGKLNASAIALFATAAQGAKADTALQPASQLIVDRKFASYSSAALISGVIPLDDTRPQVSEGSQILSITITPKKSTNILRARFSGWGSCAGGDYIICSLFDSITGSNAIQSAAVIAFNTAGWPIHIGLEHEWVCGSASSITVQIRIGTTGGSGLYLNSGGSSGGGRVLGGSSSCTLVVEEINV